MQARSTDSEGIPAPVPRLLDRAVVWVVFVGLFASGANYLFAASAMPRRQAWITIATMLVLLAYQLVLAGRHGARFVRTGLGYALLPVQVVLGFAPMLLFDDQYIGLPHFVVGSALIVLPPRWNWVAFGAGLAAMAAVPFVVSTPVLNLTYNIAQHIVAGIVTGFVVYGVTTMASLMRAMHMARTEMARLAVSAERTRFARDLHDHLGHSLSAISLKSELAHRMVSDNPPAEEELAQITEISRRALAEMRSVASGYQELSLAETAASARSVLAAARVDVHMHVDLDQTALAPQARTVLATVLREGVTNVLRHSAAGRCDVTIREADGRVELEMANDGVAEGNGRDAGGGGTGLRNLSDRVADLDGTLVAGIGADGRYSLLATVPTRHARPGEAVTASRRSARPDSLLRDSALPAS